MNYGEKIKFLREEKELTLIEMANILNISDSLYSRYEKEIQIIPLKHLNNICNYFNTSIDYIFDLSKKQNYPNTKNEINPKRSGERLKNFRKELKLTQKELAEALYVARGIIGEYENGHFLISTHLLYTICKNYNLSADYLLGRINEPIYLKK